MDDTNAEHELALTSFPSLTPSVNAKQTLPHIPAAVTTAVFLYLLLSLYPHGFTSWLQGSPLMETAGNKSQGPLKKDALRMGWCLSAQADNRRR